MGVRPRCSYLGRQGTQNGPRELWDTGMNDGSCSARIIPSDHPSAVAPVIRGQQYAKAAETVPAILEFPHLLAAPSQHPQPQLPDRSSCQHCCSPEAFRDGEAQRFGPCTSEGASPRGESSWSRLDSTARASHGRTLARRQCSADSPDCLPADCGTTNQRHLGGLRGLTPLCAMRRMLLCRDQAADANGWESFK